MAEVDPENAIDAAEAAALLTAAFREGRRPTKQEEAAAQEAQAEFPETDESESAELAEGLDDEDEPTV